MRTAQDARILVATDDWRRQAIEAFRRLGRGSKRRCATELRFDPAMLTRLLNGKTATSELIGPISRWLGINEPQMSVSSSTVAELVGVANALDDDEVHILLETAKQFKKRR